MTEKTLPPFSARNRGAHAQIDNDCPETARVGLLYLLDQLVKRSYVEGWPEVVAELQRIARVRPGHSNYSSWLEEGEFLLRELPWDKVFDFCERLYGNLTKEVGYYDDEAHAWETTTPKSEVQEYTTRELQHLFHEENLAFEFSNGVVRRRGRRNTADQVSRAEVVLGNPRLAKALAHFNKALRFFRNVSQPDFENTIKEAVCAVEATARSLFPEGGSTLGDVVRSISGTGPDQIPKPIANTFHGLYGFRNSGGGVGHGGADGGPATKELAEYALAVAASQIVLLVDLAAAAEPEVPF